MLEKINNQFELRKSLLSSKYHSIVKREQFPKYFWEMYPLVEDYYHELNPCFLFNIPDINLIQNFSDVYMVKDGYWTFANYLLNNLNSLSKSSDKLFLIDRGLAPLVPGMLRSQFAVWDIVKRRKTITEDIKKIILFAFISEEYLGDLKKNRRIESLKSLPLGIPVDVLFLNRRNIFEEKNKEQYISLELMGLVKDLLKENQVTVISMDDFLKRNDLRGVHLIDLAYDNFLVSDNYIHHFALSLGATMDEHLEDPPLDSIFNLALSFRHDLHISPLPELRTNPELFSELLYRFKFDKKFITSKGSQQILRNFFDE